MSRMMARRILAIDAGILNLGWAVAEYTTHRVSDLRVLAYGNEDVTRACRVEGCSLPHSRELWDRLHHTHAHVLRDYAEEADTVLLERQPPGGLGEVTAFFYSMYRDKATYIHPRSMHTHYGMGHLGYDDRKRHMLGVARQWVPHLDCGVDRRTHDVADALGMMGFWLHRQQNPVVPGRQRTTGRPTPRCTLVSPVVSPPVSPPHWMDRFKCVIDDPKKKDV